MNFLLLLFLARFISPDGYGSLNLFNTLISLLSIVISLNTTGIISVEYFNLSRRSLRELLNCVFLVATAVFCTSLLGLLLLHNPIERVVGLKVEYQFIALLICYMQVFSTVTLDIWRLEEKPVMYGIYSMVMVALNFGVTFFMIIALKCGWEGRIYAQLIVGLVFMICTGVILSRKGYLRRILPPAKVCRSALGFGLPLIPHSTSVWLRQGVDRYIINYSYTTAQVGIFSFAYNIANIIHIVGLAFNATNSVYIYKSLAENPEKARGHLYKQTRMLILFFFSITLLVCIGASISVPYLLPQYENSIKYLFPLCMSAACQCIYYLFVNYLFYYKKTRQLMYITFTLSVVHLLLSLIFTRHSIMWTAYITLIINFLIMISVIWYSQKLYPLKRVRNA